MPTKDEEARTLARLHYAIEAGISEVFRVTAPEGVEFGPDEPKLPNGWELADQIPRPVSAEIP